MSVKGDKEASSVANGLPNEFNGYRLRRELGEGAMGRVLLARDLMLERDVALKFIKHESTQASRFLIEARAAARLHHPNIATVYTTDEFQGQRFIVSEYVHGSSLEERPMPVTWQEALEIGLALSRGVAALHRHGILHRDIKPANVVMSETDGPKLVDFGLAKFLDDSGEHRIHPSAPPPSLLGTPHYMAPEIWRREPATARTDVYALGVLLFRLCTGHVPHFAAYNIQRIEQATCEQDAPPLASCADGIDARFAAIVDRCLARDPGARFESGDALRDALEKLQWAERGLPLPEGNPYPGLVPFDVEHQGSFFGRDADVRGIIERLRNQSLVLIAGDSGVGKSSLVRAGVLPRIKGHGLDDGRTWSVRTMMPAGHATASLARELGRLMRTDEHALARDMAADPMAAGERLRAYHGRRQGTLIFIDHLEELDTLEAPAEIAHFAEILAHLANRTPGVRIIATVRIDKVSILAAVPAFGPLIGPALYIVRPLDDEAVQQAIVGPAHGKGVRFESDEMVADLVSEAHGVLPLLQFALAQLWERRDVQRNLIPESALAKIGGVAGALSRHADRVMKGLTEPQCDAADDILLRLVTAKGISRPCAEHELVAGNALRRHVLGKLHENRLVVVRDVDGQASYQIAHEALISGWSRLRQLLDKQGGLRAVKERLASDAEDWHERGRPSDFLWPLERLREASPLRMEELPATDAAFLRASRGKRRRTVWLRRLAAISPLLMVALVYGVFALLQWNERRQAVNALIAEAGILRSEADRLRDTFTADRELALEFFRSGDVERGEDLWTRVVSIAPLVEEAYDRVRVPLESAFLEDPRRGEVRAQLIELVHERMWLADAMGRISERDLALARLAADGELDLVDVSLSTEPSGLPVSLYRYHRQADGAFERSQVDETRETPGDWQLEPGSYVWVVAATGRTAEVSYPFRVKPVRPAEEPAPMRLHIEVPAQADVPPGFIYVAPGVFLMGYGGDHTTEHIRKWFNAMPLHERRTGAYLIARHETTYADWLAFLNTLPPEAQAARLPKGRSEEYNDAIVELRRTEDTFELVFGTVEHLYRARLGELFRYPGRGHRSAQDWLHFPVTGISYDDVQDYLVWLRASGRVPGARLCREDEWERAARGADARLFSHGDRLLPDDANFDLTYGRVKANYGFDEVGTHPLSDSPFGVQDMIGNAREMMLPLIASSEAIAVRSGAYFWGAKTNAAVNYEPMVTSQRTPHIGVRVCADWPAL